MSLGAERTVPWLTWRAVDDKKRVEVPSEPPPASGAVVEALQTISDISAQIKEGGVPTGAVLSQQTVTLVTAVARIGAEKQWDSSNGGLVNRVAGATGLPLDMLTSAADIAVKELQSSAVTDYGTLYASDPHLGMFGGEAERDGYRLSLVEFRSTNSAEFLALDLLVASIGSTRPLEGVVIFYLHPTFTPRPVGRGHQRARSLDLLRYGRVHSGCRTCERDPAGTQPCKGRAVAEMVSRPLTEVPA